MTAGIVTVFLGGWEHVARRVAFGLVAKMCVCAVLECVGWVLAWHPGATGSERCWWRLSTWACVTHTGDLHGVPGPWLLRIHR